MKKMIVRVIDKPATQALLKKCRQANLDVNKSGGIYKVTQNTIEGEQLVMVAINGYTTYLCRFNPDYFPEINSRIK